MAEVSEFDRTVDQLFRLEEARYSICCHHHGIAARVCFRAVQSRLAALDWWGLVSELCKAILASLAIHSSNNMHMLQQQLQHEHAQQPWANGQLTAGSFIAQQDLILATAMLQLENAYLNVAKHVAAAATQSITAIAFKGNAIMPGHAIVRLCKSTGT